VALRDEVLDALVAVEDPLLRQSLAGLDMVRLVEDSGGDVRLRVALPVRDHPDVAGLHQAIVAAVSAVAGVRSVDVGFTVMTDAERDSLRERLVGSAGPDRSPLMDANTRTRVLAIASGKGGVGKSSVTVNVAVQLARAGKKVAVIDADVWGFSIPRMLGLDRPPHLIGQLMVPPQRFGVAVISMGFFVEDDQPVIWRGPMLHKALQQFLTDVYWGDPDYLLVDMPPGTGDISLSIAQFLPRAEVVVVTTPQRAAQKVAQRAALMARKVNQPVMGVIENMSWFTGDDGRRYEIFGAGGGQSLADDLEVPLLGRVPLSPELREGGDDGEPVSIALPDHEAAQAFAAIAREIDDRGPRRRRNPALSVRPG
jgi:ATP-binding protein involved in chromosome partitioning